MSKIFAVSDQPVLLRGFASVLETRGFEMIACCAATDLANAIPASSRPDIILLDITAGLTFGSLTDVHSRLPDTPVVLWAEALPLDLVFKTFELGVRGIVQRTASPEQLADSLGKVASGEMQIGFGASRETAPLRKKVTLTPREREIVSRLRQGLRNKQIAAEMNITEGTVKIYLFRLFHKLGVRNRFELASCGILDQLQFTSANAQPGPEPPRQETGSQARFM